RPPFIVSPPSEPATDARKRLPSRKHDARLPAQAAQRVSWQSVRTGCDRRSQITTRVRAKGQYASHPTARVVRGSRGRGASGSAGAFPAPGIATESDGSQSLFEARQPFVHPQVIEGRRPQVQVRDPMAAIVLRHTQGNQRSRSKAVEP